MRQVARLDASLVVTVALCVVLVVAAVPPAVASGDETSAERPSAGVADASGGTQSATVSLSQRATGNVFRTDETVAIDVSTGADAVAWTVTDADGLRVASGTTAVVGETTLEPAVEERGYYRLRVWPAGDPGAAAETTMAVLPADGFENDDDFYGITTQLHANRGDAADQLLEAAGVASARVGHDWHEVERTPGEYDFAGAPRAGNMGPVTDVGLSRVYMLAYGNVHYTGDQWNAVPNNASARRAYVDYAKAAVRHYDLRTVEVWNEFNRGDFVSGPGAKDPAVYARLLEDTYPAMKSIDSEITVVGGATAANPEDPGRLDWEFWRGILENGGADYMDVQSFHAYRERPTGYAEDVSRLRNLTREHNDGETMPIWVTEFAWSTRDSGGRAVSEPTQARYLVKSHVRMKAAGVDRVYWFLVQDLTPPQDDRNWHQWGLIRHPRDPLGPSTPKPSYPAYATMTRQLAGLEYQGELSTPLGVDGHTYGTGSGSVQVLWAGSGVGTTDVTIETDEPVTLTTMTGETRRLVPHDGEVYVTVGSAPLYIEGIVDGVRSGAPVSISGADDGSLELAYTNDGETDRAVTHTVAGKSVEVSAAGGDSTSKTISVPPTYSPVRPAGSDAAYPNGGHRVVDSVRIDGEVVGYLSTRIEPSAISPAAAGLDTAEAGERQTGTPDATPSGNSGTKTGDNGSEETTSASGPGFDLALVLFALVGTVVLVGRRRR